MFEFNAAITIADASTVGQARRLAATIAERAGFDATEGGRVALVATELANNVARHARAGELLMGAARVNGCPCVDVIAIDRGPGMEDVGRCLRDGYSSIGTPGTGLGAVRRLASRFDMYSRAGEGTVVFARLASGPRPPAKSRFEWAAVCRPAPHETQCGDVWRVAEQDERIAMMVADGLGHGPAAAEAARVAGKVFDRDPFASPRVLLENTNAGMQGTRGAAVASAWVDAGAGALKYAGVGNIAGVLHSGNGAAERRGLVSHNGIVGQQMRTVQEFDHACAGEALLLMHSDGLQSRWTLDHYSGLDRHHPGVIAGALYRDFRRDRDDVTVGVVRIRGAAS